MDSLGLFLPSLGFALEGAGATAAVPAGVANGNKWNEVIFLNGVNSHFHAGYKGCSQT